MTCGRVWSRVEIRFAWQILLHTFATFSEHALHFPWQAQHFGRVHLHFLWQAQHLDVSFANCIGRAARSGDRVEIAWQVWHFLACAEILQNAS